MADTSASTLGCRSTRPTNADAHPGRAIQKRKRQTKEEIARDKALIEETRNKKKEQTEGIAHIAELED